MHVILKLQSETERSRRMLIRAGQVVRVGSTEWSDFCVSHDPELAEEHFAVECTSHGCRIRALGEAATTINGEPVEEYDAQHGDLIAAGRSEFRLEFSNADRGGTDVEDHVGEQSESPAAAPAAWPDLNSQETAELCADFGLSEEADQLLTEACAPDQFVAQLLAADLPVDAVQFMSHALPKRSAVWWASGCIESLPASDVGQACLAAAKQWCLEPTEEHRQACGAGAAGEDSAAAQLAWAAYYSGGSLAPPDLPEVPPAPAMTANTVIAALIAAASDEDEMTAALARYAEAAAKVAAGDVPWSQADKAAS